MKKGAAFAVLPSLVAVQKLNAGLKIDKQDLPVLDVRAYACNRSNHEHATTLNDELPSM